MIKANELRIGNWVYSKSHNWNYKVILLEYDKELNAKPIPLTEEILIKCGFVKVLGNYEMENFRFYLTKPANYNGMLFCEANNVITDKIQYLHQLQNMYQLLTNEELTIQL